jgi:hypothetical protein
MILFVTSYLLSLVESIFFKSERILKKIDNKTNVNNNIKREMSLLSGSAGAGASASAPKPKSKTKKSSEPVIDITNSVFTLTFGDAAENHVGMEMIGSKGDIGSGFTVDELHAFASHFKNSELYVLNSKDEHDEAAVLVIRNYLNDEAHKQLFEEQAKLDHDKKALMYGRVVNKKARWNLCFDDVGHDPDYESGKGRVVSLDEVPLTKELVESFPAKFGTKSKNLKGEGNYYYDVKMCGIGWHGDSERRKVIAIRLGGSMDICYRWYHKNKTDSDVITIPLNGGDLYIMSEKAVGNDWKSSSKYTLRHAAGFHAKTE